MVNQIFGIMRRELCSGSYHILKFLHFVASFICSWVVLLIFFLCITRLVLVGYYSILHYGISIICFSVILHLACVLCTQYSCIIVISITCFCHSFFEHLNFVYIDIQITYLHLALIQIQCILTCTPCVDALQWVWVD